MACMLVGLFVAGFTLQATRLGQPLAVRSAGFSLSAQSQEQDILNAYAAARPADHELGVFQLNWADSFKDAKARATKEKRPIFLICTTQLKDAGNLRDGHC